jgi:hypothetical protein
MDPMHVMQLKSQKTKAYLGCAIQVLQPILKTNPYFVDLYAGIT